MKTVNFACCLDNLAALKIFNIVFLAIDGILFLGSLIGLIIFETASSASQTVSLIQILHHADTR